MVECIALGLVQTNAHGWLMLTPVGLLFAEKVRKERGSMTNEQWARYLARRAEVAEEEEARARRRRLISEMYEAQRESGR